MAYTENPYVLKDTYIQNPEVKEYKLICGECAEKYRTALGAKMFDKLFEKGTDDECFTTRCELCKLRAIKR